MMPAIRLALQEPAESEVIGALWFSDFLEVVVIHCVSGFLWFYWGFLSVEAEFT